jgi:hypothetical protein
MIETFINSHLTYPRANLPIQGPAFIDAFASPLVQFPGWGLDHPHQKAQNLRLITMLAARRAVAPLSRAAPTRSALLHQHLRCFASSSNPTTTTGPLPVDIEHYTSGWTIADIEEFTQPGKYAIQTYDKISPIGLAKFPKSIYTVAEAAKASAPAHALLLRSYKLQESEVDISCRAIARCGAGTNNIPVAAMTKQGIPVFNTPGANANSVKELILAGMLLGSRRIVDGINHMKELGAQGLAKERVEKDKAKFGGREIKGKTLAVRCLIVPIALALVGGLDRRFALLHVLLYLAQVVGLGHIGSATARDAAALGMKVQVRSVWWWWLLLLSRENLLTIMCITYSRATIQAFRSNRPFRFHGAWPLPIRLPVLWQMRIISRSISPTSRACPRMAVHTALSVRT